MIASSLVSQKSTLGPFGLPTLGGKVEFFVTATVHLLEGIVNEQMFLSQQLGLVAPTD